MGPISRQPWQSVLTTVESGSQPDQEAPVRLVLFQAEDLLPCKHWSEKKTGPVRGSLHGGLWPVSSPPQCAHLPTLTQEQVEDPGGHPAGAEGGHQAAEIGLPAGLQLLGHRPGGIGSGWLESQCGPTPPGHPLRGTCTQPPATAARAPGAAPQATPGAFPGPRAPQAVQGALAVPPRPRPWEDTRVRGLGKAAAVTLTRATPRVHLGWRLTTVLLGG